MSAHKHPLFLRFIVSTALVIVGVGLRLALPVENAPSLFLLPAMVIAAWYGGLAPGLLATLLSVLTLKYFFLEPKYSMRMEDVRTVMVMFSFALTGAIMSIACESMHQARFRLSKEKSESELQSTRRREADAKALQYERLRRHSEQRFATLTDAMPHLVRTYNPITHDTDYVNRNWIEYTGLDLAATNAAGCTRYVHPDDQAKMAAWFEGINDLGETGEVEVRYRGADGSYRWFVTRMAPQVDENGKVIRWICTSFDVTNRKAAEERFRLMADSAPVLVWLSDATNACVWVNQPCLEYTGRAMEQELGDGWVQGIHPADTDRCVSVYNDAFHRRDPFSLEYRLRRADGEYRWQLTRGRPLFNGDGGAFSGFIGSSIDIADKKHAEAERDQLLSAERAARSESERANHLKDEFLATLSHELRTPLNAIAGWAQLLQSGPRDEQDLREGLEVIGRNAEVQTRLIEDLLDLSRITTGKMHIDVARVDLTEVIQSAVAVVLPAAKARRVELRHDVPPRDAVAVHGDASRLQQVIWNLLSNAVKFTPGGGTVSIALTQDAGHAIVTVTDTGQGISPEFVPHLFERFRQADASTRRHTGGLGIGLALVRNLVEVHGGSVEAFSAGVDLGASFTVALPLAPQQTDAFFEVSPQNQDGAARALESELILVVDDDADARIVLTRMLELFKARVITAGTADDALRKLREQRPGVIISDIGMPGRDGYSLIAEVRQLPEGLGGATPAIALTAYARPEDRCKALASGYQAHLIKPVQSAELCLTIIELLSASGDRATL